MSEVKEVQKEIDQISAWATMPNVEMVKLLRLIAVEQAKIIDLLKAK